jgi:hypothetical protein
MVGTGPPFCLFVSELAGSSQRGDENRWERNPNALRNAASPTEFKERKARTNLAQRSGLDLKKKSGRR